MAPLLDSILNVVKAFQGYATENGDGTRLCKQELKQLLLAEFGSILRVGLWAPRSQVRVKAADPCTQGLLPLVLVGHAAPCN